MRCALSYFDSISPIIKHASFVVASAYDCVACPLLQVFLGFFLPRFPTFSPLHVTTCFRHPSPTLLQLRWFAEPATSTSPFAIFTTIYAYSTSYDLFCCVLNASAILGHCSVALLRACMVRLMVVLLAFGLYLLFSKVLLRCDDTP